MVPGVGGGQAGMVGSWGQGRRLGVHLCPASPCSPVPADRVSCPQTRKGLKLKQVNDLPGRAGQRLQGENLGPYGCEDLPGLCSGTGRGTNSGHSGSGRHLEGPPLYKKIKPVPLVVKVWLT